MKLDDLCGSFETLPFPRVAEGSHPDRETVLAARSVVTAAVANDELLADCISWELDLIERGSPRRGLNPFFAIPELGVGFAFGYWAPGATPGPHEHTAWTITAVCRNELEVVTYDYEQSYQRQQLVQKNCFHAEAGRVGFIYEPCIHAPKNTSREWSLSLHVVSSRDGERPPGHETPLLILMGFEASPRVDHPYMQVVIARQRDRKLRLLGRILVQMISPEAHDLAARCFDLASPTMDHRRHEDETWVLARVHKDLVLRDRREDGMVSLDAETSHGLVEELRISDVAGDAITYASTHAEFDIRSLPGDLSDSERVAIAEVLEQTGLFTRVRQ